MRDVLCRFVVFTLLFEGFVNLTIAIDRFRGNHTVCLLLAVADKNGDEKRRQYGRCIFSHNLGGQCSFAHTL